MRVLFPVPSFTPIRRLTAGLWLTVAAVALLSPIPGMAQAPASFPGSTAVGASTGTTATVSVPLTAAGTMIAPGALTEGAAGTDFKVVAGGTCTAGSIAVPGGSCTVRVVFQPTLPGARHGAVLLTDSGGRVLGSQLLVGQANGSLAVLTDGRIDTVAGDGTWIYRADGIPATSASIFLPMGVAQDGAGNLYLSDSSNNRLRRVDAASGLISTVAGDGTPGFSGDGGAATAAQISAPSGLVLDGAGNLYFTDTGNHVVRRVDARSGIISTVAGAGGVQGYSGDGGPGLAARLSLPQGLGFDSAGDLLVADTGNNAIREVDATTGLIRTIAGTGAAGYNGDGQLATAAQLSSPWSVLVGTDGTIFIADLNNNRVRAINVAGVITTVAGTGQRGFGGEGALATNAELNAPAALAQAASGDLFIGDSGNNRVRVLNAATKALNTVSGTTSEQFAGDGGPATLASLYGPYALFFAPWGDLMVADMFHNRVRRISGSALLLTFPTMRVGKVSAPQPVSVSNEGNAALAVQAPGLINAALDPTTTTCTTGSTVGTSDTCIEGAELAPAETGGEVQGTITVKSDAGNTPPVITLEGEVLSVEPTSVTLTSNNNPSLLGANVTFTATVSSADTNRSGTVAFMDASNMLCAATLSAAGTAICSTSTLTLGDHSIKAAYSGDGNNAASASAVLIQDVQQATGLVLSASPNPSTVGKPVVLSLTATAAIGMPTGVITFYDGTAPLATVNLSLQGTAMFSASGLLPGQHTLTAKYPGDTLDAAGTSNAVLEIVEQRSTTTTLATSSAMQTVGYPVTFTAAVSSAGGAVPTGTVTFTDHGVTVGTVPLDSNGTAQLQLSTLTPGTHSFVASYAGDTDDGASASAPLTETIIKVGTVTTLASDANPVNAGAALHLTATVAALPGSPSVGTLTGTVTFSAAGVTLGTGTVNASGIATTTVKNLSVGTHPLIATYSGNTDYATSTSAAMSETVQATQATVQLTSAATTTLSGEPASFTAAVTSPTGIPTGTVTFQDGSSILGHAPIDGRGVASFSLTTLSVGTHSITAVYGGDGSYLGATSTAVAQTVVLATSKIGLTASATTLDVGTPLGVMAAVSSNGVAPTGTVTLLDGSTVLGTVKVSSTGGAAFSIKSLSIGQHTLTASYSGDVNTSAAISVGVLVTVRQAGSTTSLTGSGSPSINGQTVTLTAHVASDSPNITGEVDFLDGATILGSQAVANGIATFSTAALLPGSHSITAAYRGDTDHAASTSVPLQEQIVQASAGTLSSSANPSIAGASVTFTAHVSPTANSSTAAVATGTVVFSDGSTKLAVVTLDAAGTATFSTASLSVGSHAITAAYEGDANYATTSASLTQAVSSASTQVTIAASANPATYGKPLLLTATVSSNGGVANGSVTFEEGTTPLGQGTLNASGVATLSISTLTPGVHTLVAVYGGSGSAGASSSAPLSVTVEEATAVELTSSVNPVSTLAPVVLTAVVSNSGVGVPTGQVTFLDGAAALGTASVDASGRATLTLQALAAGTHTVTASYGGDPVDFAGVSPAVVETVQLRPTAVSLAATASDPANPQEVLLVAIVQWNGPATPTGTVTFTSGGNTLGSVPVDSTGVGSMTVVLAANSETVVATYSGDISYATSSSAPTAVSSGQGPKFTVQLSSTNMTLVSKQRQVVGVTLTSLQGFTDMLQLGCLGLPYAATCTFSQPQMKLAADGTASLQLTIDTGDPLGEGSEAGFAGPQASHWTGLISLAALLLLLCGGKRKRKLPLLLVLAGVALAIPLTGCAGLRGSGTPAGQYSFKVTAAGKGTGLAESQTVVLTVTQ